MEERSDLAAPSIGLDPLVDIEATQPFGKVLLSGRAVLVNTNAVSVIVSEGCAESIKATVPATCGAAIDVPL